MSSRQNVSAAFNSPALVHRSHFDRTRQHLRCRWCVHRRSSRTKTWFACGSAVITAAEQTHERPVASAARHTERDDGHAGQQKQPFHRKPLLKSEHRFDQPAGDSHENHSTGPEASKTYLACCAEQTFVWLFCDIGCYFASCRRCTWPRCYNCYSRLLRDSWRHLCVQ